MRKLYLLCVAALSSMAGIAQVSITSLTNPYTQNFDGSLASTGATGTILPAGWLFSESGTNANATYGVDDGTSLSGNTNSYGSIGSTERAFGGLLSGSLTPTIGVGFTNNSGSTITSIAVNYYGERWRLGAQNRVDNLTFQYSLNATGITTGTYTTVNQLSYEAPASAGTVGAVDGNVVSNRTNIVYTITGLSIPAGTSFYFRWNDVNVSGNDDGLAVDDVVINFNGNTQPPCTAPTAQPGAVSFNSVNTNSFNVSFAAASPVSDEYLAVISTSATLSAVPANGTAYDTDDPIGNGIVAFRGSGTSFSQTNLSSGTTYYLFVFSLNSNCSNGPVYLTTNPATGSQATTTPPVCAAPTGQPGNVVFSTITGTSITGSFTAAADADGYLAIISSNTLAGFVPANGTAYTASSTAGNGTVIKYGTGNTFSATGLTPATTYYFTFYALNGFNCTSGPAYNTTAVSTSTATNNNTSGIPVGYYDTVTTQSCAPLKSALKWRTTAGMTPKTYNDLWAQYTVSDIKPREVFYAAPNNTPNVIWDIYSDNPTGTDPYNFTPTAGTGGPRLSCSSYNYSNESDCYNREHSVPQNWFMANNTGSGSVGPESDYHHIFPTDGKVNSIRNNYIFGEVTSPTITSINGSKLGPNAFAGLTGTAFEPLNEYKGDLARAFLYFVTRYENNMPGWPGGTEGSQAFSPTTYPSIDIPYLQLMMKWNTQDPVSQKEIDRNNVAFTYQGNRNPYIDHPEYVDRVWGSSCFALPVQLVSFKGSLRGEKVILDWQVKNESNLLQYEIERSDNNSRFIKVGSVKAANRFSYQFSDDISNVTGRRLYYRLKRVDTDGNFVYSDVFTVHVPLNLQFSVYPNPVTNGLLNVQLAKPATTKGFLQLTDAAGRSYQNMPVSAGTTNISINVKSLAPGMYVLRLTQQSGNTVVQKVQVL